MGNCGGFGFGCVQEDEEFEKFRGTGGVVRVLIVSLNYQGSKHPIVCIKDGEHMEHLCELAEVSDVTFMRDDLPPSDPLYPSKKHIIQTVRGIGEKCRPNDYFVWFYAGHGENVPDTTGDEEDGMDEAFVLPEDAGIHNFENIGAWLIDDLFAESVDKLIPVSCRVLALNDCCHSASICDVDSYSWRHRVISIGACQDDQESIDTDYGGALSLCLKKGMDDLAFERGSKEYSIASIFEKAEAHLSEIHPRATKLQQMSLQYANCDPNLTPWPMPHPWWKK